MAKQIALVTGANRGLGLEVATQLVRDHGFDVWMGARDLARSEAAAARVGEGARAVQLDMQDETSIRSVIQTIEDAGMGLDVLINNAGVDYDTDQNVATADMARVRSTFDTNFFGPWTLAQRALPLLRRSSSARIVNVSSGSGALDDMGAHTPGYGLSKLALNGLTMKLASALRQDGILVNAVCPGWVATDMGGGGRPIPEGAKGIVWAATLPDGGPTGGFFRDGQRIDW